jgi:hypothetical protein
LVVLVWPFLGGFATGQQTSKDIIEESYSTSQGLSEQDRGFFLVRLTDISTSIVSPERTESWCTELWQLVPNLPPGWNRVSTAKNALVPLSRVNPARALELLAKVENPVPEKGVLAEDVRADAAVAIYMSYLHSAGVSEIDKIRKNADGIGETGEYPYRAMGLVIEALATAPSGEKIATDIFNRALHYYSRGSTFQDEDSQFFALMQSTQLVVSEEAQKKGLKEFIKHLTTSKSKEPPTFQAEVRSPDGVFTFDSQKKLLLFEVFPTIVRFDRLRARDLLQEYPWLAHAGAGVQSVAASGAPLRPSSANLAAAADEIISDKVLAHRVYSLQQTDPVSALADARLLSNSMERVVAVSSVIPALWQVDKPRALDAYRELRAAVDTLPDGRPKLRGLVALAKTAYFTNSLNDFTDFTSQAFDYGIELSGRNPADATLWRPGAVELTDIASFVGEHQGDRLLPRIRALQDHGLRAYLLLFTAKGLGKAEATEKMLTAGRKSVVP